jgi:hypothetical protein
VIDTGGIFDWLLDVIDTGRAFNWALRAIDTRGIFDWLDRLLGEIGIERKLERLKNRKRFTYERHDPSLAASLVAVGGDSESLGYLFEFRQQVFV